MTKSYILNLSNKATVTAIENKTTPIAITLGKTPFSFVIHVKYARIGQINANIVQPIMQVSLYTPYVTISTK